MFIYVYVYSTLSYYFIFLNWYFEAWQNVITLTAVYSSTSQGLLLYHRESKRVFHQPLFVTATQTASHKAFSSWGWECGSIVSSSIKGSISPSVGMWCQPDIDTMTANKHPRTIRVNARNLAHASAVAVEGRCVGICHHWALSRLVLWWYGAKLRKQIVYYGLGCDAMTSAVRERVPLLWLPQYGCHYGRVVCLRSVRDRC